MVQKQLYSEQGAMVQLAKNTPFDWQMGVSTKLFLGILCKTNLWFALLKRPGNLCPHLAAIALEIRVLVASHVTSQGCKAPSAQDQLTLASA
ncbi:hypothetical protein BST95_07730 [Halioglobus japonicus]|uniref:Uncharacterized protein n=1 Tax=Halioglobus japonicus TaxID=930805 RepID=A0AAP8ME56_9GAMM|nr:hypothetical protein BST95_07730 [Halioglobus japonicus]PLW86142.1 hypothetical protein C0029_06770 [Halioglobus japonicus]